MQSINYIRDLAEINGRYCSPLKGLKEKERKRVINAWYNSLEVKEKIEIDRAVGQLCAEVRQMGPKSAMEAVYQSYAYVEYLVKMIDLSKGRIKNGN